MALRFGTDGVRGVANTELTPELVLALGRAAAHVLGTAAPFVVGRDTRRSGPMLEAALVAGLAAEGAMVEVVGVLPTPGVARAAAERGGPAAVISASHNPFPDNGVKLFAPGGRKLDDARESAVEAELAALIAEPTTGGPGRAVGVVTVVPDATGRYVRALAAMVQEGLEGFRVLVDPGHGAATDAAPQVLELLGASVEAIHAEPDGTNINRDCGSMHPEQLCELVAARGFHAGLAFDGDADRVIAVDERGNVVDGDEILAVLAIDLRARDALRGGAVAATVMSNLGLRRVLDERGIRLVETPVGDRHVLAAIEEHGLSLGGEQSGHVILADRATTGDGILTGLALLEVMARTGRPLSQLASVMTRYPQVLRNVPIADRAALAEATGFWETVRATEAELGAEGRVVVRLSGTEPVVRVMVEAATEQVASAAAESIVAAVPTTAP